MDVFALGNEGRGGEMGKDGVEGASCGGLVEFLNMAVKVVCSIQRLILPGWVIAVLWADL